MLTARIVLPFIAYFIGILCDTFQGNEVRLCH
jgi:hypothetical protein